MPRSMKHPKIADVSSVNIATVGYKQDDGIMIQTPDSLPLIIALPHRLGKKGMAVMQVSIEDDNTITKKVFDILPKRI